MVRTECKLDNTELLLKLFQIQSKEIGNKWQILPEFDVREEMEDSRPNALKQLITFLKFRLNFSSKITTAVNVHLTKSLLANWSGRITILKNFVGTC